MKPAYYVFVLDPDGDGMVRHMLRVRRDGDVFLVERNVQVGLNNPWFSATVIAAFPREQDADALVEAIQLAESQQPSRSGRGAVPRHCGFKEAGRK